MGGRWLAFGLNMPQAVSVFANDQLAWPESQRSLTELLHPRYRVPPVPTSTFAPPGAPQRRGIAEGKDTRRHCQFRHVAPSIWTVQLRYCHRRLPSQWCPRPTTPRSASHSHPHGVAFETNSGSRRHSILLVVWRINQRIHATR